VALPAEPPAGPEAAAVPAPEAHGPGAASETEAGLTHGEAAGAHEAAEGGGEHGAEASSPLAEEHGSWFYGIAKAVNHAVDPSGKTKILTGYMLVAWLVGLLLVVASVIATGPIRAGDRAVVERPGKLLNFFEWLVGGLFEFFGGIIGPHGAKYAPLVVTYFVFILCNNWIAVVPGFVAPTSALNTTLALGLSAFLAVQFYAIRANGLKGYLLHFAGQPKDVMGWFMAILLFPLEVIGELVKPLSLSMRLFGNIFGEDTVVLQILLMWLGVGGWKLLHGHVEQSGAWWVTAVPMHLPMMAFSLFGGLIQALVFSILVSIYISLLTSHDEAHDHDHHPAGEAGGEGAH
jgi:F-type H+-transporting ATPase subunit a